MFTRFLFSKKHFNKQRDVEFFFWGGGGYKQRPQIEAPVTLITTELGKQTNIK